MSLVNLNDYVRASNDTLVSNRFNNLTNFVPFFNNDFGLFTVLKYSQSEHSDIIFNLDKSFTGYCPVFKRSLIQFRVVLFKEFCTRLPLSYSQAIFKKKVACRLLVDLDEISPVEDDNPTIMDDLTVNPLLDDQRYSPIILQPLSLESLHKKRVVNRIYESEQKKLVRITIMYTLAFFALAIMTFFIIYLA